MLFYEYLASPSWYSSVISRDAGYDIPLIIVSPLCKDKAFEVATYVSCAEGNPSLYASWKKTLLSEGIYWATPDE